MTTRAGGELRLRGAHVLFAMLMAPICAGAQSTEGVLTLQQAIELGLRHNRLIRHERLEVEKASDKLAALATRRMPGVDVSVFEMQWINPPEFRFSRGVFGSFPGLGPVPPVNTTISSSFGPTAFIFARATQPLTQLHRIGLGMRMGEINRELAESRLQLKQREVTHQIKRSYYAILQTQSALQASEETLKLYRELDRVVGEYVAQQISLASDSLDIRTQMARHEYETLRLQNAAWNAMEWFEVCGERYCDQLEPEQFMYSMLTRSQRISHENLRLRDKAWLEGYERWLAERAGLKTVQPVPRAKNTQSPPRFSTRERFCTPPRHTNLV